MAGQRDFLEKGPCGQFHMRAGGFRIDDLQMSKHQFDYLITALNAMLRAPGEIQAPMARDEGAFIGLAGFEGAALFLYLAEGMVCPPLAVAVLAVGSIAYATLPTQEDVRQRYDQDVRDAHEAANHFFRTEFVAAFSAYGVTVDLDEGCEDIFTTERLTFHVLGNTIQQEGDAVAPSAVVQGDVSAVLDHPGRRRSHRQRLRAKQFWNRARASTPDAMD
jgi:hypothetical protein